MEIKPKTALILAPHTDDGEFGCGGTVGKLIEQGTQVVYVAFSSADTSLPVGFAPGTLRNELYVATAKLGLSPTDTICLDYQVRRFSYSRQDILDDMLKLKKKYRPDIVFIPSSYDTHQDHETIHNEGIRAFKQCTVLGYEAPWNNYKFSNDLFSKLNSSHIELKIEAIGCYKSQNGKDYASAEYILSLAKSRGVQIGCEFAECFEVIRVII